MTGGVEGRDPSFLFVLHVSGFPHVTDTTWRPVVIVSVERLGVLFTIRLAVPELVQNFCLSF